MKFFTAHFVLVEEHQWFRPGTEDPERVEQRYYIDSCLFVSENTEAAFQHAQSRVPDFNDANHDGPGDLTKYYSLGLHDLEALDAAPAVFPAEVSKEFGLAVGHLRWDGIGRNEIPVVRQKHELSAFL